MCKSMVLVQKTLNRKYHLITWSREGLRGGNVGRERGERKNERQARRAKVRAGGGEY